MKAKTADTILVVAAFVGFWAVGVSATGQDPKGVDLPGLIGGLIGVGIAYLLVRARRGGGTGEKAQRHSRHSLRS